MRGQADTAVLCALTTSPWRLGDVTARRAALIPSNGGAVVGAVPLLRGGGGAESAPLQ